MNAAVIGLGLMGGAVADGLRAQGMRIYAFDTNEETLEEALSIGAIDWGSAREADLPEMLAACPLVFVCLYPKAAAQFITAHMNDFAPGALVTDIAGLKGPLIAAVAPVLRDDIDFIPGHPMAGSEKEGFGAAGRGIFENRNYVLVPLPDTRPEALEKLKGIIRAFGFSHITETTAEEHDRKIAFTSELCHVIASALVDCEEDTCVTDFEGGSFGDLTRIAMINAPMWTEIFIENKRLLLEEIDAFMDSMHKIRAQIEAGDAPALTDTLAAVRARRVAMEVERLKKHRRSHADGHALPPR